jgi:hypothetical protein
MDKMRLRARHFAIVLGAGLAGGIASPILADDSARETGQTEPYPYVTGGISAEFYLDATVDADNRDVRGTDAYSSTELNAEAHVNRLFSIVTGMVVEPVEDRLPREDRYFEDHGLYVEQLYGKVNVGSLELLAGKFNAAFGRAWDDAPGIYGTDMAADYELTERVGAGVILQWENTPIGSAKLQASAFHVDTSVLARSAFTNRGVAYRFDGGLSDTGGFDSFAISLDGEKLPQLTGVSYTVGFVHQAAGEDDVDDQNGFVFGVQAAKSYNSVELRWIAEAAYFDYGGDLYGSGDPGTFANSLFYFTAGLESKLGKYHAAAAYSMRQAHLFNGSHFDDWQYQLSAGKDVGSGWSLDLGYKVLMEAGKESRIFGLMLIKTLDIDTRRSGAWIN